MQCTRRQAIPLRVHQIWDAIGRFSSTQIMDFEKLLEVVTSMHKVPRDELHHELDVAIKDGLVVTETVESSQKKEETEIYKLPDISVLEKDKGDHDWYCFSCHLGGSVVKCEDCPRVYHLDCLPDDRKPDKDLFVCPACHIVSAKPSAEKLVGVKAKQLNELIEYVCERINAWNTEFLSHADGGKWAKACSRTEKESWRFPVLVYTPIDVQSMLGKARGAKYVSLEEFQVDCETLVHAIGVYFGPEALKGSSKDSIGAQFIKEVMHDIQEIKLCHHCFRRSNEKNNEWWFCLPCTPAHEVVFAKQTGYPYWPAKVMKREGTKYDVRYFGEGYLRGHIDGKNIQPIDTPLGKLRVRRNAAWNEAFEELQKFQELAANPAAISELPASRGKGASKKGGNKRTSLPEEEQPPKKVRKSEPAAVSTPTKAIQKKVPQSAKAVLKSKESPAKATNGNSSAARGQKKGAGKTGTPTSSSKDSYKGKKSSSTTLLFDIISADESLDPELKTILLEPEDDGEDEGVDEVTFSDDDEDPSDRRVSEDAVSSSCNEMGKSSRNVYVQHVRSGVSEVKADKLVQYINQLKDQHRNEIEVNKKKQWCFNCGREAIYHCCWNTAYCSIECQQQHWTSEHKRLCRREVDDEETGSK